MTNINVYLNFPGNAEAAFAFYRSVFGGELTQIVRFKDMPVEGVSIPASDQDKVMHVGLPISDRTALLASDVLESQGGQLVQGNNVYVSVHPDNRSEADRIFNALSAGGTVEIPIGDQPWGDYYGAFEDKFGVHWMVNFHEENVG